MAFSCAAIDDRDLVYVECGARHGAPHFPITLAFIVFGICQRQFLLNNCLARRPILQHSNDF